MEIITFECETITPMFLAGANGTTPELRAASIKGALRFWWRAMHGDLPVSELHDAEAKIFGSTKVRSKVIVRVEEVENIEKFKCIDKFPSHNYSVKNRNANILEYLAYGIIGRYYIKDGFKFSIIICIQVNDSIIINDILNAFYLVAYAGGIGAKSRNGFGRFRIIKPQPEFKSLKTLLCNRDKEKAGYTAFSKDTKLYQLKNDYRNWDEAIAQLGFIYRNARLSLEKLHCYEKRSYIAAPIIAYKKSLKRHAKTFFLTINKSEKERYQGYILSLPYNYCEKNTELTAKVSLDKYNEVISEFNNFLNKNMKVVI